MRRPVKLAADAWRLRNSRVLYSHRVRQPYTDVVPITDPPCRDQSAPRQAFPGDTPTPDTPKTAGQAPAHTHTTRLIDVFPRYPVPSARAPANNTTVTLPRARAHGIKHAYRTHAHDK